ncbi:MAG: DUF4131 domain-containing protein [Polyangiaceae bacterium]|nr:DUF4131 domain-containing protein [Polyangiaceae bacterium]
MSGRDRLLLLALTAYVAGGFVLAPVACGLGVGVGLLILRVFRVVSARGAAALLFVFAGCAVRGLVAEQEALARYESARRLASPPAGCVVEGIVVTSPQARADIERFTLEATGGTCRIEARNEGNEASESAVAAGTRIDVRTEVRGLTRGARVHIEGKIAPIYLFENPGLMPAWVRIGRTGTALSGRAESLEVLSTETSIAAFVDRARARVRDRIRATYHPEAESLGRALVLGETDLDQDVNDAFRVTGLSHILAVSGTHLVVTVLALTGALRALLLRWSTLAQRIDTGRLAALASIPIAWLYSDFAGGSGSVVRAAAMLTAILSAQALERRPCSSRSLAAAIGLGVVLDPVVIADVSFTLSTAATAGLLVLSRPLAALFGAREPKEEEAFGLLRRIWNGCVSALAATLGATIACAPMTAILSPALPLAGLFANLVAAPLGEAFALPFAVVHAMLSPIPALEQGAAHAASGALRAVLVVAKLARETGATLTVPPPTAYHLVVVGIGATWMGCARGTSRYTSILAILVALGTVELGVRSASRRNGVLSVTALDVGQGDAILVDLPDGGEMLVDGGGFPGQPLDLGERVIAPVLRARRRDRLDLVVLSHPHPDHYLGLPTTLRRVESVGELWHNGYDTDDTRGRAVREIIEIARSKGAVIRGPDELCDGPRTVGGATIEVLAPCPELDPELSVNDGSVVLKITHGNRSALLLGDAEEELERRLLDSDPSVLDADLMKVGHHGSRTSTTPELLEAVSPSHAVISCGVRNTFGHPHAPTLEKLGAAGVPIARTDVGGAWTWSTDGDGIWVR